MAKPITASLSKPALPAPATGATVVEPIGVTVVEPSGLLPFTIEPRLGLQFLSKRKQEVCQNFSCLINYSRTP